MLAAAALAGGTALEIGKVALTVAKQKSDFSEALYGNPISYILDARKLQEASPIP
jgi:hypothetical protein